MTTTARTDTMRAAVRDTYGPADVIEFRDVARPVAGKGQVLVRVHAAGLDRGAWHIMLGKPYLARLAFGLRRPRNPGLGLDLAGTVESVGEGVTAFAPGDAVFGSGSASFAEYTLAKPGSLAHKPESLTFEQAAAVPVSGVTALQALRDRGRLRAGQRVLVIGASGGVGTFAVQIAKADGAHVTGVCSPGKIELVRSLGADAVVDRTTTEITDGDPRYDLVLDIGGNRPLGMLQKVLTPRGTLVIVGGEDSGPLSGGLGRPLRASALSLFSGRRMGTFISTTNSASLDALRELIEAGAVTPVVDGVRPMSELPAAMRDLEAGRVRGKIVLTP